MSSHHHLNIPMLVFSCTMYITISQILLLGIVSQVVIATLFPKYDTIHLAFVSNQEAEKLRLPECGGECDGCCWCDNSGVGSLY